MSLSVLSSKKESRVNVKEITCQNLQITSVRLGYVPSLKKKNENLHEINESFTKILGRYCNVSKDSFNFKIHSNFTKIKYRHLNWRLSAIYYHIARIFDPLISLVQRFITRGERTTSGTRKVCRWYAKKLFYYICIQYYLA